MALTRGQKAVHAAYFYFTFLHGYCIGLIMLQVTQLLPDFPGVRPIAFDPAVLSRDSNLFA